MAARRGQVPKEGNLSSAACLIKLVLSPTTLGEARLQRVMADLKPDEIQAREVELSPIMAITSGFAVQNPKTIPPSAT